MEIRRVQETDVPALGLGTWELEGAACREVVATALDMGYRHIDTAQVYGNEDEVGAGMATAGVAREEIFLTTKVWNSRLEPDRVRSTTEDSLRRLRTDYVDLLLIHWPARMDILPHTLEAMLVLRDAGKVRHVGVSNFTPSQLAEALRHAPIFCNQVEYHPFLAQDALLDSCRTNGVLFTAYSPIARGRVLEDPVLTEIGGAHDRSPAQVALRWLLDHDQVAVVPKASTAEHLRANLDVFGFSLTPDERRRIAALDRGERLVDPDFAPDWAA